MLEGDYIGLDVGMSRTGIARASAHARLAEPLRVVPTDEVIGELKKAASVSGIVIGLPRNLEGNDTAQTKWVRQWTDKLKDELKWPLHFQDEALTTREAQKQTADNSLSDAYAAAIILQDFLDGQEKK